MAVNLSPVFGVAGQLFDNNGNPLAGGKIFTYAAGTTTPAATYTSSGGGIAHTNPIILDGAGRVPNGEIWLTDGITYKFVVQDSANNLIGTYDNINGINSNFVAFTNQQEIQTATAGQTVFTLTTTQYQPGTNSLSVFVDGVNQYGPGAQYAYVETSSTVVTFTNGLHVGAEVKFTTSQLNSSGATNAALVTYDPPFVGATQTNVEEKLSETFSFEDFGAVGDGVADDTVAINAAFAAAANSSVTVYGTGGKTYRITSTININGKRFDGRNCSILKDFAGTGIYVTGGAAYSYFNNFFIGAAPAYQPTDYSASATDHGIHVEGTRVEMFDVTSSSHDGSGFYLNQDSGNANKSKYIRIAGGGNAFAGCFVDGDYPTANDFSVVQFNGRFQSNWGYGMYSSATAPMRQWDCWIYSESNHDGASAPDDGGIRLERAMTCDFWVYAEETVDDFVLGTNASGNISRSVRQNNDRDAGTNNMWVSGAYFYKPDAVTPRNVELSGFRGLLVRVGTSGEDVHIPLAGNGGNFGYWYGAGAGGGAQQFGLTAHDKSTQMFITTGGGFIQAPKFSYGTRFNFEVFEFGLVATTSNQITVTITTTDAATKHGTGLIELWLGADTDSSTARIYHLARISYTARSDTTTAIYDSEVVVQSNGFTLNSASTTGLTLTLVYDVNVAAVAVSGYAKSFGGTARITAASLS
jgi:hypothetical protein